MGKKLGRREFLGTTVAGAVFASHAAGRETNDSGSSAQREVRLEFFRPQEIDEAQAACPTIFQPLGTIEWHGVHNVVGGLSQPHTFIMDPENDVFSTHLRPWLEQLGWEMTRNGFRAIIILTGHYGAAQQSARFIPEGGPASQTTGSGRVRPSVGTP